MTPRWNWHGQRLLWWLALAAVAAVPEALVRGPDEQIAFQAWLVVQLLGVIVAAIAVAAAFSALGLAAVRVASKPLLGRASTFVAWSFLRAARVVLPAPVRAWRLLREAVDAAVGDGQRRTLWQLPLGLLIAGGGAFGARTVHLAGETGLAWLLARNLAGAAALHGALFAVAGLPWIRLRIAILGLAGTAALAALALAGRHPAVRPVFDTLPAAIAVAGAVAVAVWRAGADAGMPLRLQRLGLFLAPVGLAAVGFALALPQPDWRVAGLSIGAPIALLGLYLALQGQAKVSLPVFVSIVGVAAGVWALIVVLSVMGGFAGDLREKMLVANAHALVERPGRVHAFTGAAGLAERLRRVPGVAAVSPQARGDAILSSAFNVNNFVNVRGIDPSLREVRDDLGKTLVTGDLLLLQRPAALHADRALVRRDTDAAPDLPPAPAVTPTVPGSDRRDLDALLQLAPGPGEPQPPELDPIVVPSPDVPAVPTLQVPFDDAPLGGSEAVDVPVAPGILLGAELARSLQAELGDRVEVVTPDADVGPTGLRPRIRTFRVAGTFETGLYEADSKVAYVALAEAARYFNLDGDANVLELRLNSPDQPEPVLAAITAGLKDAGAPHDTELLDWRQINRSLFSALAFERLVIFLVLGLIILVAAFSIVSALTMVILQKHDGIAMLRAMGSPANEVRAAFVQMGGVIGAIGTMAGAVLGLGTCLLIDAVGIQLPEAYYVRTLPVAVQPLEIALVVAAAVAVSLAATVVPATSAARLAPLEGLRHG